MREAGSKGAWQPAPAADGKAHMCHNIPLNMKSCFSGLFQMFSKDYSTVMILIHKVSADAEGYFLRLRRIRCNKELSFQLQKFFKIKWSLEMWGAVLVREAADVGTWGGRRERDLGQDILQHPQLECKLSLRIVGKKYQKLWRKRNVKWTRQQVWIFDITNFILSSLEMNFCFI